MLPLKKPIKINDTPKVYKENVQYKEPRIYF